MGSGSGSSVDGYLAAHGRSGVMSPQHRATRHALRLLCGLFFLPHVIGDATHAQAAIRFYDTLHLLPGIVLFVMAIIVECIATFAILLDFATPWAALLAAAYLGTAAAAVAWKGGGHWLWNKGGVEYLVFWSLCCLVVAWTAGAFDGGPLRGSWLSGRTSTALARQRASVPNE